MNLCCGCAQKGKPMTYSMSEIPSSSPVHQSYPRVGGKSCDCVGWDGLAHSEGSKFRYLILPTACSTGGVTLNGYQCSAYGWQAVDSDPDGTFHTGCANPDNDPNGSWCGLVRGTTTALGLTWDYCQPACTDSTGGWDFQGCQYASFSCTHPTMVAAASCGQEFSCF